MVATIDLVPTQGHVHVLIVAKKSRPSAVEKSGVVEGLREFREGLSRLDDDGARVVLGFRIGVGGERRDDGFFELWARVVPRDAGIGFLVRLVGGMHGGGACHSTVELDVVDDGVTLLRDGDEPFDTLVMELGGCLARGRGGGRRRRRSHGESCGQND